MLAILSRVRSQRRRRATLGGRQRRAAGQQAWLRAPQQLAALLELAPAEDPVVHGGGQEHLPAHGKVLQRGGEDGLLMLTADAANLPTPNELEAPGLWIARLELQ